MEFIQLDGKHLTLGQYELIVRKKILVKITKEALERVQAARTLIYELDKKCEKVYGLNTGVGWNKDRNVCQDFFDIYNKSLLRSHCIGIMPDCTEEEVRGAVNPVKWIISRPYRGIRRNSQIYGGILK